MRKQYLYLIFSFLFAISFQPANAQPVNAVLALAKDQASGCNGQNRYVVIWASAIMWAPKGSNANMVSNPIGVLQNAAGDCMERGYVPTGGMTYVPSNPAYYYQPMFLKAAQGNAAPQANAPIPSQPASSPATQ